GSSEMAKVWSWSTSATTRSVNMSITAAPGARCCDLTLPAMDWLEKFSTVTWSCLVWSRWTMTSMALLDTSGTSTWTLVAMPWRVRTARMPRSRDANEVGSCSCCGRDPYKLEPRGILDGDSVASGR